MYQQYNKHHKDNQKLAKRLTDVVEVEEKHFGQSALYNYTEQLVIQLMTNNNKMIWKDLQPNFF
jgi:hypothetical protein